MAVRVTDQEVKEIMNTNITDTAPFIIGANSMINNQLSAEITAGSVSATTLKEMERWLSAHFASAMDQQPIEEAVGEAKVKYQGYFSKGLSSSVYGQRAMDLDPTGRLGSGGKASSTLTAIDFIS